MSLNIRNLSPPFEETIEGTGKALRAGWVSCEAVLDGCLARIEAREQDVHAWVVVDRAGARAQAKELARELAEGKCRGLLHGIPIGIKDIIDVAGLPTAAGFEPWGQRVAGMDAPIVAALRRAGAVILGKTVTTQFAWIDPPVTRNPWNLDRTPGGSSSGSAAAVASGMCLAAIGSQTGGSIIRPAAFCGVAGFKPTHGEWPVQGIIPFSPSLDHPGPLARTAHDLRLVFGEIMLNLDADQPELPLDKTLEEVASIDRRASQYRAPKPLPPRLIRPRGFFDRRAEPEMLGRFEAAVDRLVQAGASVIDRPDDAIDFEGILSRHRTIMAAEAAAWHESILAADPEAYRKHIRALVEEGLGTTAVKYVRALGELRLARSRPTALNTAEDYDLDAIITPATVGPAPDLLTTGNPCMNAPWSYFGWPAVALPIGLAKDGLPIAMQLVGPPMLEADDDLLMTASWCQDALGKLGDAGGP